MEALDQWLNFYDSSGCLIDGSGRQAGEPAFYFKRSEVEKAPAITYIELITLLTYEEASLSLSGFTLHLH